MRREIKTGIPIVLSLLVFMMPISCVTNRPPKRIQDAIHSVNKHLPKYVEEANRALVYEGHPDREHLVVMGTLLVDVLKSLERWANGNEPESKEDGNEK